jgi:hypothetical protein
VWTKNFQSHSLLYLREWNLFKIRLPFPHAIAP